MSRTRRRTAWFAAAVVAVWAAMAGLTVPEVIHAADDGGGARVLVIPVKGNIEPGVARFVERGLATAERQGSVALIEISTFGGRVDAATDIRGAIDRAVAAGVRVIGWVPDRAISAGALIAIATQDLYMAPGSTLGAAEPRPADEKTISLVRAEFEAAARSRGRDPRVAAAMVDKNVAIPDLVEKGEILTLTADRARDIGFIEGLAADRQAVLQAAGLAGASVSELAPTPAERVARFVTDPIVAPLLLSLGMAGLIAEFYVPGFGFPGVVGLLSLTLFFGGHLIAGVAGWEIALLFLAGLLLLGVELLAPGFGVFGIAGLLAVGAAIVLVTGDVRTGLQSLLVSLLVTAVVMAVLARHAGRRGLWRRLALPTRLAGEEGFRATGTRADLVGRVGRALTPLRPAGAAEIAGERVDVVTEGDFIAPGDPVVVVRVEGMRVVVRRAPEAESGAGQQASPSSTPGQPAAAPGAPPSPAGSPPAPPGPPASPAGSPPDGV